MSVKFATELYITLGLPTTPEMCCRTTLNRNLRKLAALGKKLKEKFSRLEIKGQGHDQTN